MLTWTASYFVSFKLTFKKPYYRILLIDERRSAKENGYWQSSYKYNTRKTKRFFGHVMQKDGLERLAILGKVPGKRGRGRPRRRFMDFMCESLGMSHIEAICRSQDRHEWIICRQCPLWQHYYYYYYYYFYTLINKDLIYDHVNWNHTVNFTSL